MSVEDYFWLLGGLMLASGAYGALRYRTPLNPISIFCVNDIGLITLVSGIVACTMSPITRFSPDDAIKTVQISIVYLIGFLLPFTLRARGPARLYGQILHTFHLDSETLARRYSPGKLALILAVFLFAFAALMAFSGGGLLWITNSREAYTRYREGTGPFVTLTQWSITFALIYTLWSRRPRGLSLLTTLLLFSSAVSFLGSKNYILTMLVIGIAYYQFCVQPIPLFLYALLTPLAVLAALGLLVAQGTYTSLGEAVFYLRDFFDTSAQFMARFNEFGFYHGQAWLSSFWFYVPRALYPNKPYEYGVLLIHRVLFPGAAASGYTPGYLPWTLSYLDFGVAGVLIEGMVRGIFERAAFEYFLRHRNQFFAFVLMLHFALWPIWTLLPFVLVVPLCLCLAAFLHIRVRLVFSESPGERPSPPAPLPSLGEGSSY